MIPKSNWSNWSNWSYEYQKGTNLVSFHLVALGGDNCEGFEIMRQIQDGTLLLGDERGEAGDGVAPAESQRLGGGFGEGDGVY